MSRARALQDAATARGGAPPAVHVVERWPGRKNLSEAVQRVLPRPRPQLDAATWRMRDPQGKPSGAVGSLPALSATDASESARQRANRSARYRAAKQLQAQGGSQPGSARTLVRRPNPVRRSGRASPFPARAR